MPISTVTISKIIKSNKLGDKGFTIVEILIALSLVGLVFTLVINTSGTQRQDLENSISKIERAVRFATNESILRNSIVRISIDLDASPQTYVIEYGQGADFVLPQSVDLSDLSISEREKEIEMKEMIEEFAIFANMYIGEYLKHNNSILQYGGIFRSCDANVFVERYKNSDENIYKQLIKNNITAEYTDEFKTHDMIACDKMYTHFTSPIRRFSDCLCHFLLKYIYLKKIGNNVQNVANPFTEPELKSMIKEVHIKTKKNKKISYLDQKFRKIQAMFCLLQNIHQKQNENTYIIAECEIVSYKSGFVNLLITHIISNLTYSKLNINLSCSFWKKKNVNTGHLKVKISTMNLYSYQNDLYIPFTQSGKIKDNEVFPEIYQKIQEL